MVFEFEWPNNSLRVSTPKVRVHDVVNIRSAGVMTELLIYDSKGTFVFQKALNETETQLNVSTFHAGLYLLRIKVGD